MSQQFQPSQIRFTQDSISEKFGERGAEVQTIEKTFEELLYGETSVSVLRPISVIRVDGVLWVVSGNRRLYVFKMLEKYDSARFGTIRANVRPVNQEKFGMKTTKNEGRTIYIRQDRTRSRYDKLENRINNIYQKWIKDGRPTDGRRPQISTTRAYYGDDTWSPSAGSVRSSSVQSATRPSSTYSSTGGGGSAYSYEYRAPTYRPDPPRPKPAPASAPSESWCTIL